MTGTARDLHFMERDFAATEVCRAATATADRAGTTEIDTPLPGAVLHLRRLHGYRCSDRRMNNVHVLASQEVVLFCARVAIVLDRVTKASLARIDASQSSR